VTGQFPAAGGSGSAAGDPPSGARLLDAVAVMDRLRAPGGCPWDAEQTHDSLLRYLIEECYELVQAVEAGDPAAIREELGDVLLQVLFHARIAAERPGSQGGFDIDDVAGDLVDKLVRRHPHVFDVAAAPVANSADQQQRWDELKKTEQGRSGVLDGVAFGQPAAALSAKLGSRAAKFDLLVEPSSGETPAEAMFRIAYAAGARGEDPESALRTAALAHADSMAAAERARDEVNSPTG